MAVALEHVGEERVELGGLGLGGFEPDELCESGGGARRPGVGVLDHAFPAGVEHGPQDAGFEEDAACVGLFFGDSWHADPGEPEDPGDVDLLVCELEELVMEVGDLDLVAADLELGFAAVDPVLAADEFWGDDGAPVVGPLGDVVGFPVLLAGGGDPVVALSPDAFLECLGAVPGEEAEEQGAEEACGDDDGFAAAVLLAGVGGAGDEAPLLEGFLDEHVAEEVGLLALPHAAVGQGLDGHAERFGELLVEGGAFAHGGGEVDAAQEKRLARPHAAGEDDFEVELEARANALEALGKGEEGVHLVGAARVGVVGVHGVEQQAEPSAPELVAHGLEVLIDELGVEGLVELGGVGPAEHLEGLVGCGHVLEELAEAVDEVALGDDDEDGESHFEDAADDVELLCDLLGLGLDGVGGVGDEGVGRDDEHEAVDGAGGAGGAEEAEELLPLACGACLDLLEHEAAGGVENNGVVGEPPVHVDGAAGALEGVLEAGWEAYVAVADGLGLAGAWLADEDVPGEAVDVLACGSELLDAALEVLPQVVEPGAAAALGDALWGGRALVDDALLHGRRLALLAPLEERAEGDQHEGDDHHADHDDHQRPAAEEVHEHVDGAAARPNGEADAQRHWQAQVVHQWRAEQ